MSQLQLLLRPPVSRFWPEAGSVRHSSRYDRAPLDRPPLLSPWEETGDCEHGSLIRYWLHPDRTIPEPDRTIPARLVAAVVRYVTSSRARGWFVICHGLSDGERVRRCRRSVSGRAEGIAFAENWLRSYDAP